MPFNFQTFKTRALTALLFVAVMLVGLLWNFWSFVVLFTVIHFGCWYEYLKLVEKINTTKLDVVLKWLLAICGFALMVALGFRHLWVDYYTYILGYKVSFKILFWVLLFGALLIFLIQNNQVPARAKRMCVAGFAYISASLTFFLFLRDDYFIDHQGVSLVVNNGLLTTCGIMASIWVNDTMAYLVGSFIGRTPLSKISPKKTWEGTIGGVVLCVIVIGFLYPLVVSAATGINIGSSQWFIIPALCAIFGTIGDLFESKLKRMAEVKDSGSFMPGHGGFLDRFDSLLFAVPAVWVYVYFFLE